MLATPDGELHNYRKIHLFSRETELFERGDAPPPVINTPAGRVGLMICFDWFFPETARLLALAGAQIIAHPSNLVLQFCQKAMYARSVENRVFTITANRVGAEERVGRRLVFTGASQVLDPKGNTLVSASDDGNHAGLCTIDPSTADDKQVTPHNHLFRDRLPELYRALTEDG
jgi:predicted amidohydrolase